MISMKPQLATALIVVCASSMAAREAGILLGVRLALGGVHRSVLSAGRRALWLKTPGVLSNEKVVMAEWALPGELDNWSVAVGDFATAR
jgi:hypothetical protein